MPRFYALSDLHLHAPIEPFLFTPEKERVFCAVAREADAAGATVLLAGDILDLTSMTPPRRGLAAFFDAVGIAPPVPAPAAPEDQIEAIAAVFPLFFEALRPLAQSGRLRWISGNHDCALSSPSGRRALAAVLGVAPESLPIARSHRERAVLFACHGNEFDPSNETAHGCVNRGSIITAALYHAVMPALRAWGFGSSAAAIPAVRPEENVVDGLEQLLGPDRTRRLLYAFVVLLEECGYFTGANRVGAWLATHAFPFLLRPAAVRRALADDTNLKDVTRAHALALLEGAGGAGDPPPNVVVMGHTHELDATPQYVNLGSWIDHVRGIGPEDLVAVDRTLPVFVLDADVSTLHDCRAARVAVDRCPVLWRCVLRG